mmetsp:Transcript_13589/g.24369  ORF Transcript_13589/g.24369 Transcript_13589/m.24369 type:complete len:125 (+) Transcript_13589:1069-1443(+)
MKPSNCISKRESRFIRIQMNAKHNYPNALKQLFISHPASHTISLESSSRVCASLLLLLLLELLEDGDECETCVEEKKWIDNDVFLIRIEFQYGSKYLHTYYSTTSNSENCQHRKCNKDNSIVLA